MNEEETRLETAIQDETAFELERLQLGRKIPVEANPYKADLAQADLSGANLSRANLTAMNLQKVQYSLTRLGKYRRSFEVDFLVCCPTRLGFKWAILEIDGYWHFPEKRAKEQERERLFEHSGIRVYRFDAKLCSKNPEAVVSELLEIMSK